MFVSFSFVNHELSKTRVQVVIRYIINLLEMQQITNLLKIAQRLMM